MKGKKSLVFFVCQFLMTILSILSIICKNLGYRPEIEAYQFCLIQQFYDRYYSIIYFFSETTYGSSFYCCITTSIMVLYSLLYPKRFYQKYSTIKIWTYNSAVLGLMQMERLEHAGMAGQQATYVERYYKIIERAHLGRVNSIDCFQSKLYVNTYFCA